LSDHEDEGLSIPGRWVNSHDLLPGDVLLTRDGRRARLQVIHQRYEEQFRVVNLTIAEHHTFAVGAAAILVHNTSGCGRFPTSAPKEVVDKSWKLKIHGRAQATGTPRHRFRSYREAITEAKKPNVRSVHLDHGYNRGLELDPKTIQPNRRPDVLSVYDDGTVARIEVMSKTDVRRDLMLRNKALDAQIRSHGFTPLFPRVVEPR